MPTLINKFNNWDTDLLLSRLEGYSEYREWLQKIEK